MQKIVKIGCGISIALMMSLNASTQVEPKVAMEMLNKHEKHFEKRVYQTAPNVYTAVGFHGANTSMIVGDDGVIIIDTLMGPESATNALKAFRKHSKKPVKAIIYTHSHGDHIGGAKVFMEGRDVPIYAMENFAHDFGRTPQIKPIMQKRGIRQFGRKLKKDEMTNRGVAPAGTIDHDRGKGHIRPTVKIDKDNFKINIAGVDIELIKSPGETDDALFIWLPKEKVLFSGDNFYKAFPNLYAIRGTEYRDMMDWSRSVALMASFKPEFLIPGHTTPIKGQKEATQALSDYSNAIKSIHTQTLKGINEGKSPEQIAHEVKLPKDLASKPYLTEFYGTTHHAVKAIYSGILGWYDGNPTTLNALHPKIKAQKIAQLAGGVKNLEAKLRDALKNKQYQWALELSDYIKWLDGSDFKFAIKSKIEALRALGAMEYNAPNRNYYLSYANELESGKLNKPWF